MTPPVRLVATDLDGTLVRSDGSVSARTRAVLSRLDAAGVVVVFVTGRPLRWARDVFEHVGGHGHAIVSNGALVWDVENDRPSMVNAIPDDAVLTVSSLIRDAVPDSHFAIESLNGIHLEAGFMERHPLPVDSRRGTLPDLLGSPVLKLLARHETLAPQEFWDLAESVVGDLAVITWSSDSTLLEISDAGVTKASALASWAASLGISREEVVAFGDMPNDIPMLQWAGRSYAMANAHPTVLAAADELAPHHDDDGVAAVLETLTYAER